ncbi:MAG TPA: hypothetical protein PK155_07140 [Bacteroidales bacterium]|nr:hypothetical protein [Bacteroidales bacterium]
MADDKRLLEIATHYGLHQQMRQTVEEMAELTQAICKVYRYGLDKERDSLVEELADVDIMVGQLIYLLGDNRFEHIRDAKITRQLNRIKGEGGGE